MAIERPDYVQKLIPQIRTEYTVCFKQPQHKHRTNAKSIHIINSYRMPECRVIITTLFLYR